MKKIIAKLATACGYTIVPHWRSGSFSMFAMAWRLREIFDNYQIDRVIDVGANKGQYRDFLRLEVGFHGFIDSFEPIPDLAGKLKERAATDPKWRVHATALGAEAGEATINVMARSEFSSFRKPVEIENAALNQMNTVVHTATVPVSTLDLQFSSKDHSKTYVKLDTQGFDLEVLRGGMQLMSVVPAMQSEVSFRPFYEGMPGYRDAIAAFEQCGFRIADFFLAATDGKLAAMEFDCVMIRSQ